MAEIWTRPWALFDLNDRKHRFSLDVETISFDQSVTGPLYLYAKREEEIRIDGKLNAIEKIDSFELKDQNRTLYLLALPLKKSTRIVAEIGKKKTVVEWTSFPGQPIKTDTSSIVDGSDEQQAFHIKQRMMLVWDRVSDVETALADPMNFWKTLSERWTNDDIENPPRMDLIVKQARDMVQTLKSLELGPRRILRRTNQLMPMSRIQEMDRRSLVWLMRQPGETLAERGGDKQKLMAVARQENFDTLENRGKRCFDPTTV